VKGSLSTASLTAGASLSGSGSVSTTGLSVGTHTLSLLADANNVVAESNETNNSLSQSFTVTASAPSASADLSISGLSAYASTLTQGDQLIFAYTLKNTGTGSAAASKVAYSVDALPTASSNGGTNSFGAVAANSWNSSPIDFISTSNLSVGTHTLYVTADVANSVSESNETNNTAALTFTVQGKSDFAVSAATTPDTVKAGGTFNLNYTVTNAGQGNPNYYTYAAVYFDGRANAVSYDIIKNLNPGASQSITDTFSTYGVAKGTHTLTITSDALNFVNESNELNNSKTITFKIV
jgi:subtilase family serine protease